ncbi:hypothetical protein [Dictyobacter arantiisoli]|uniref:Uncharacterized protein n=1 Tax=Dictyobacter arantiisoli TaxID=2014874 RepID=A0A5A5TLN6_9CHLR|nr:hypothetical protein [Dictyobacter arantiisoli]GCF11954.1 hypothetical protein KDI_55180 [Dictyobacter arantiisoli]
MAIRYKLSGKQQDQLIEREGTLADEQLTGVNVKQDTALINAALRTLQAAGVVAEWEKCTLQHDEEAEEQVYIRYKKRWTHSSKIHSYAAKTQESQEK